MPDRYALWGLLGVALLVSVVTDLKSRRIPDWVTYPTIALALGLRFWREGLGDFEHGLVSGLVSGLGAALLFTPGALRKKQGFGWGDVKLVAAAGAVFGYPLVMAALIFISLVGALQGIVVWIWTGSAASTVTRIGQRLKLVKGTPKPGEQLKIPYAVAIALGCFWAMWWDQSN